MRKPFRWISRVIVSISLLAMCHAGYSDDSATDGMIGATLVSTRMLNGLGASRLAYVAAVDQIAVCGTIRDSDGAPQSVEIRLLSNKDMALVSQVKNQSQFGIGLSFSTSGKKLVAHCLNKMAVETLYVYDCTSAGLSLVKQKEIEKGFAFAIPSMHAEGKCVIGIADYGPQFQAVDLMTDKMPTVLNTEWDYLALSPAAVSRHGTHMAIGRHWKGKTEFTLGIWEMTGKQLRVVTLPDVGSVSAVEFSPDGSTIVTGTSAGKVHVWKALNDSPIIEREFELPTSCAGRTINDVKFSEDSRIVTATVGMHRIVGWDADTAKLRFVIYHEFLTAYTWLDRPDTIATVREQGICDSELKVWKLSSGDNERHEK